MISVVCDSCKKLIPGALRGINYVTYLTKELCFSCEGKMRLEVMKKIGTKRAFTLAEYHELTKAVLEKNC